MPIKSTALISLLCAIAAPFLQAQGIDATAKVQILPAKDTDTGEAIPLTDQAKQAAKAAFENRTKLLDLKNGPVTLDGDLLTFSYHFSPETKQALKDALSQSKLSVHALHKDSDTLADEVAAGENIVPGYRAYVEELKKEGEIIGTRNLLVTRKPALTGADIAKTTPNVQGTNSMVGIELTDVGAKKMEAFTRSLTPGRSQIASIIDGKVVNRATLQAEVLTKHFVISGLDNLQQCKTLATQLATSYPNPLKLVAIVPSEAKP